MKRTIRKRILSGLLAVMMIVSNVNVSTYAAEDEQIVQELEPASENTDYGLTDDAPENAETQDSESPPPPKMTSNLLQIRIPKL